MNFQPEVTGATEEAEESLLGAIMVFQDKEWARKAGVLLEPYDFLGADRRDKPDRWAPNARFFYAITKLTEVPNQVTIAYKLSELGLLQDGDCIRLSECIANCPCTQNFLPYAREVKEYSIHRQAKILVEKGDIAGLTHLTTPMRKGFTI
jgi:replicative DNA helicase